MPIMRIKKAMTNKIYCDTVDVESVFGYIDKKYFLLIIVID